MENKKWYVLHNGEVVFTGTEEQCRRVVCKDPTGELEMYPSPELTKDYMIRQIRLHIGGYAEGVLEAMNENKVKQIYHRVVYMYE